MLSSRVASLAKQYFRLFLMWNFMKSTLGCVPGITAYCKGEMVCGVKNISISSRNHGFGNWSRCINDSCILHRELICSEEVKCHDLSPCDLHCDSHYTCQSGKCVLRSTVCDGSLCSGCEEDHEWNNGHGFKCPRNGIKCILPQQLLHDNISDCDGGNDLCFKVDTDTMNRFGDQLTKLLNTAKCFQCLDNSMLIPASRICDGIIDCSDLSDECLCEDDVPDICTKIIGYERYPKKNNTKHIPNLENSLNSSVCMFGKIQCDDGICMNRGSVCDGQTECSEDESNEYCDGTLECGRAKQFEPMCRCMRHSRGCVNHYGVACDGVPNCPIPVAHTESAIGENTFPEDECLATCRNSNFTCLYSNPGFVLLSGVGFATCYWEDNSTTLVGPRGICNGILDCPKGEDENHCELVRFKCKSRDLVNIDRSLLCDGTEDCEEGEDETIELCGDEKFYCSALGGRKVSVPISAYCDFAINCDDASDEANCSSFDDRFYCENKDPLFVRRRQTFDGKGDCSDWSDECPTINQSTSTNVFSSRYELLANPILRTLVWIMGFLSFSGNLSVIFQEIRYICGSFQLQPVTKVNRMLILNLAVSDIIMGIYLIGLGIAGLVMQGRYCSKDLIWRSSSACISLGVLSVISSEASVMTMVLLTCARLYAILRPFESAQRPGVRYILFSIIMIWILSIIIALLPLTSFLSEIFVAHATFSYNPFLRNVGVSLDGAKTLFKRTLVFDLKNNVSLEENIYDVINTSTWHDLELLSKKYFVHSDLFSLETLFGYYSVNSVCIPKYFVTRSDPAWQFSLTINIFNFVAFIFVVSMYLAIYFKSTNTSNIAPGNKDNERNLQMQKKILRLVATDFCCWIPICIIAICKFAGAYVDNTAYAVAAVVLLPINSALNPILYSNLTENVAKILSSCVPCRRRH
ncbi:uncharacterized protein LOC120325854 isoform X1 [Styela clava]